MRYLEVAELAAAEEGAGANNVVVGIAVLAGIAASDAICLVATGSRYAARTTPKRHGSWAKSTAHWETNLRSSCDSSQAPLVSGRDV